VNVVAEMCVARRRYEREVDRLDRLALVLDQMDLTVRVPALSIFRSLL
jgi:hypothetical protein